MGNKLSCCVKPQELSESPNGPNGFENANFRLGKRSLVKTGPAITPGSLTENLQDSNGSNADSKSMGNNDAAEGQKPAMDSGSELDAIIEEKMPVEECSETVINDADLSDTQITNSNIEQKMPAPELELLGRSDLSMKKSNCENKEEGPVSVSEQKFDIDQLESDNIVLREENLLLKANIDIMLTKLSESLAKSCDKKKSNGYLEDMIKDLRNTMTDPPSPYIQKTIFVKMTIDCDKLCGKLETDIAELRKKITKLKAEERGLPLKMDFLTVLLKNVISLLLARMSELNAEKQFQPLQSHTGYNRLIGGLGHHIGVLRKDLKNIKARVKLSPF